MGLNAGQWITAAGGAAQAYGSVSQGRTARDASYANASIMEQQAANRLLAGTRREDLTRSQARQVIGQQLAAGGQSGVGLSGSRLDLLRQSYGNLESDTAAIRTDSLIEATGLRNQATIARWQGDQAYTAGKWGAVSAGLNTFAALNKTLEPTDTPDEKSKSEDSFMGGGDTFKGKSFTSDLLKPKSYARKRRF